MKKIIIYAECSNTQAYGDFSFAVQIANELITNGSKNGEQIDIILTSSSSGLPQFKNLLGEPVDGYVNLYGNKVALCDLQLVEPLVFNQIEDTLLAVIYAHPCKRPDPVALRHLCSPDTKILLVNGPNREIDSGELISKLKRSPTDKELFRYFDDKDILVGVSGVSELHLGLPTLKSYQELDVTEEQRQQIPNQNFGFLYLHGGESGAVDHLRQFVELTPFEHYVLAGSLSKKPTIIEQYLTPAWVGKANVTVDQHSFLPPHLMRHMMVHSSGDLVCSTGVISTLEALYEKKVVFYQNLQINRPFVHSYLACVKFLCHSKEGLKQGMSSLIMTLTNLLFAEKPLSENDMDITRGLLANPELVSELKEINHQVVDQSNGGLAKQLLCFINSSTQGRLEQQVRTVCRSLRNKNEDKGFVPSIAQALRRSAAREDLFKLKVLLKYIEQNPVLQESLDSTDGDSFGFTALLWAAYNNNLQCATLLLKAKASPAVQDKEGHSPVYYAEQHRNASMLDLLTQCNGNINMAGEVVLTSRPVDNVPESSSCCAFS